MATSSRLPSGWLTDNLDLISRDDLVLDVASGRGRHALALALAGWRVRAVDRDPAALAELDVRARAAGAAIETQLLDLESELVDLGADRYGAIVVFNFLHRPLMPALVRALKPGGILLYETFTVGQRERGHPRNPAFLLEAGELPRLVVPLQIVRSREGEFEGRFIASIAARKRLP